MSCYISSIMPCRRRTSGTCLNGPTCIQHEQHSHLPGSEYRTMNTHEQNTPAAALRRQDCHDWRDILVPSPSTGGNIREGYCNGARYAGVYMYTSHPTGDTMPMASDATPNSRPKSYRIPHITPSTVPECVGCGRSCVLHF